MYNGIRKIGIKWLLPALAGFAVIWLLLFAGNHLSVAPGMFLNALISTLFLSLGSMVLATILRYYRPVGMQILNLGVWILLLAFATTLLSEWVINELIEPSSVLAMGDRPLRLAVAILLLLCVALITWVNRQSQRELKSMVRYSEMQQLARDAELNSLRQQLQPHFLFNSLNSIQVLIGSNPEKARKMVIQLSDYLRGTLKKSSDAIHTVADELENSLLYLEIEKTRFGDRLVIETKIAQSDELLKRNIPALVLQPLVENAVKHGIYQTSGPVDIILELKEDPHYTILEISNPYDSKAVPENKGTGFGLSSLRRRMFLLYGNNSLLQINTENNRFVAQLKIPII